MTDIETWPIIQPPNYSLESFKLCLEGNFQNSCRDHLHKEILLFPSYLSPAHHFNSQGQPFSSPWYFYCLAQIGFNHIMSDKILISKYPSEQNENLVTTGYRPTDWLSDKLKESSRLAICHEKPQDEQGGKSEWMFDICWWRGLSSTFLMSLFGQTIRRERNYKQIQHPVSRQPLLTHTINMTHLQGGRIF